MWSYSQQQWEQRRDLISGLTAEYGLWLRMFSIWNPKVTKQGKESWNPRDRRRPAATLNSRLFLSSSMKFNQGDQQTTCAPAVLDRFSSCACMPSSNYACEYAWNVQINKLYMQMCEMKEMMCCIFWLEVKSEQTENHDDGFLPLSSGVISWAFFRSVWKVKTYRVSWADIWLVQILNISTCTWILCDLNQSRTETSLSL